MCGFFSVTFLIAESALVNVSSSAQGSSSVLIEFKLLFVIMAVFDSPALIVIGNVPYKVLFKLSFTLWISTSNFR